jgi:hypothetical protein
VKPLTSIPPLVVLSLNLRLCRRLLEAQCGMDVVTADDGDVALAWLCSSYAPGGPAPADIVLMVRPALPSCGLHTPTLR